MSGAQQKIFGRRNEPHTIIIARGEDIRHFQARPWMLALAACVLFAIAIGYVLSTTYLVLRDDLLTGAMAREARIQYAYEERISTLRTQIDRITSRQVLDQRVVEDRFSELLERQQALAERDGQIAPLLRRFERGISGTENPPLPESRPVEKRASLDPFDSILPASADRSSNPALAFSEESVADRADQFFMRINRSLRSIEDQQTDRLTQLTDEANRAADTIEGALQAAGLKPPLDDEAENEMGGLGGPFEPVDPVDGFRETLDALDQALQRYDSLRDAATDYPLAHPAPGHAITSGFGRRRDPIIGRLAQHSGIDFRGRSGDPVYASADGVVIAAGWNGGYGRYVEIRHRDGYTSRYAHMSELNVRKGERLRRGDMVGRIGSSGRSTGPHLHYEIRKSGKALDPAGYIKAGSDISALL